MDKSLNFTSGITQITYTTGADIKRLPSYSPLAPSSKAVEPKLKTLLQKRPIDGELMNKLAPDISDPSILSPLHYNQMINDLPSVIKKLEAKLGDATTGKSLAIQICQQLEEAQEDIKLSTMYRNLLVSA